MATIGIVPMSAKPYHAGHDGLVRLAAKENDEVHLYVSLSDRGVVSGEAMAKIWKEQIEPSLPANVIVSYGGSPVRKTYEDIGKASEEDSPDTYVIYSDPDDLATNFPPDRLAKYASTLYDAGRLKTRPVTRTSTIDISGTKMRQFLKDDNEKEFLRYMPRAIDGRRVWQTLRSMTPQSSKRVRKEALLRRYVRLILSGQAQ